jgi:hypothetical protein
MPDEIVHPKGGGAVDRLRDREPETHFAKGGELSATDALRLGRLLSQDLERRGRTGQLIVWNTSFARAYVYAGEWVADCPSKCGNVELLTIKRDQDRSRAGTRGTRKDTFTCSYCKETATSIHWPDNADEIMEVLDRRPVPHTRNWYPEGHITALEFGLDDGQTIEELLAENDQHGIA